MSKKYVFLTTAIVEVGGGQIYCKYKKSYCEELGFSTYIFSGYSGKLYISDFKKYMPCIMQELRFNPICFNSKKVDYILDTIIKLIDYDINDSIVIESHGLELAIWGELLAKRISAKHIVYLLGEHFENISEWVLDFLRFKHKRKELACIKPDVTKKLFEKYDISDNECYSLRAAASGYVDVNKRIDTKYFKLCNNKKVIGIIGRGKKPYVIESLKKSCDFASRKMDSFVVLIIGDVDKRLKRKMTKIIKRSSNVSIILAGSQLPIPKEMLDLMDVAIAGAGCVRSAFNAGVPTISVDVYDNEAIGVFGYDTQLTISRENNSKRIVDYLEEILYGDFLLKNNAITVENIDIISEYQKHFDFIENSCKDIEYFKFSDFKKTKREYILGILYKIGGIRLILTIKSIKLIIHGK